MRSPRHSGVRGEAWRRCDRCGFEFPINMLKLQRGLWVDRKCRDNLDNYAPLRQSIISSVLSTPEDEIEMISRVPEQDETDLYFS